MVFNVNCRIFFEFIEKMPNVSFSKMINASCLFRMEQTRCNISHDTNNAKLLGSNSYFVTNCYFHNIDPADFFPSSI